MIDDRTHILIAVVVGLCAAQLTAGAGRRPDTIAPAAPRQSPAVTTDADCDCGRTLDRVAAKLEADYLGFAAVARGRLDADYREHVEAMSVRARGTSPNQCARVLQRFLQFFADGHLFVGTSPRLSEAERARLARTARVVDRAEADIRRYLDRNVKWLDPIEGIWYAKEGYRVGVVRDTARSRRDFVAIMLSEGIDGWRPGHVKAEFSRLPDESYDVVFYAEDHSARYPYVYLRNQRGGAAIRRGLLLHMPPITWGKSHPLESDQRGLLDPVDPRRPTARAIDSSTVLFSIPSHSPEYEATLDQLTRAFQEHVAQASTLIIDIRGDEGGSAGTTRSLMPFIETLQKRPSRYPSGGEMTILSSPDNISYVERIRAEGWVPADLAERMKGNPGTVISFASPGADRLPQASDVARSKPKNVGILIDGAVVSAGEAFVLEAMDNTSVTLFGQNTGGVIALQNVRLVGGLSCPEVGVYLGYPTLGAVDLLERRLNVTGIAPDVRLPRDVDDPIRFIATYYARRKR